MDLRRQVFPSPAITCAHQFNVTTCVASSSSQTVNPSLHVTPSMRAIRPNIVKSRAHAFEKLDSDVAKESHPAKTVIERNACDKTSGSSSPANVFTESRLSDVQSRKSVDNIQYPVVSCVSSDRTSKFAVDAEQAPECVNPPSPMHHNLRQVVSHPSETPPGAVTQRLKMFEDKPIMSNKPPVLPKPKSPLPDVGADHTSVNRSRSSDSVWQHNDDYQAKVSRDSAQVHDDTSLSINSRGAANKNVGISYTRGVTNKAVISPPPSLPGSVTSKVVLSKAPEKPPRLAATSSGAAHDDSYGLVVYATSAVSPLVHVERFSPDVAVPHDHPLHKAPSKPVRSHVESHTRENVPSSVPEGVLNSSRQQNSNAVCSNAAAPSSWENKFIRSPGNTPVERSRGTKENFVTKKRMNNPNYMYVSLHADNIISSQQKTCADKKSSLTRHYSDDMLNIPPAPMLPSPKSPGYREPLYTVPFDSMYETVDNPVVFDSAGYAVPYSQNASQFQVFVSLLLS